MREGSAGQVKLVTLHPDPTTRYSAVYLSLGCMVGVPVAYIVPYENLVPAWADSYAIGLWDIQKGEFAEGTQITYRNPTVTDDGAGFYISNVVQIRQLLGVLDLAHQNRNPNLGFLTGMDSIADTDIVGLWGWYDVDGFNEALAYLGCLDELR